MTNEPKEWYERDALSLTEQLITTLRKSGESPAALSAAIDVKYRLELSRNRGRLRNYRNHMLSPDHGWDEMPESFEEELRHMQLSEKYLDAPSSRPLFEIDAVAEFHKMEHEAKGGPARPHTHTEPLFANAYEAKKLMKEKANA